MLLTECPFGKYKSSPGNTSCSRCPSNSYTLQYRSTQCKCRAGFFRAPRDRPATACTSEFVCFLYTNSLKISCTVYSVKNQTPAHFLSVRALGKGTLQRFPLLGHTGCSAIKKMQCACNLNNSEAGVCQRFSKHD